MKAMCFSKLLWLTVFAGLILTVPGAVYSQGPPGPVPAGQPQPVPASEAKPQEKFRRRRRAQPFLAPGSSTRRKATTRARGGKTPEARMAAAAVADAAAWVAAGEAEVIAGAGAAEKAMKSGRKCANSSRRRARLRSQ